MAARLPVPHPALRTEHDIAAAALGLIGARAVLSPQEAALARGVAPAAEVTALARAVAQGEDPLGDAFALARSAAARRASGAVYTPSGIVGSMIAWAAGEAANGEGAPARIVDPGAGSGRFVLAAARAFPAARLVAIETDPLAALMLRANAHAAGIARRTRILVADFRDAALPPARGRTLFIGNPPYVRHHGIDARRKAWYAAAAAAQGVTASKLAGLHLHFFLRTLQLARDGDLGCYVTSAEWLDVNYGAALRRLLGGRLGGAALHVIDAGALPFGGTATTAAIACFRVGARPPALRVRSVPRTADLGDLSAGRLVLWDVAAATPRWTGLVRPLPSTLPRPLPRPLAGAVELGEICRVHRGQVTGGNAVWIAGPQAPELPPSVLLPTITRARELLDAGTALRDAARLRRVIDLPEDLDALDPAWLPAVRRFLRWAESQGAARTYVARHRRAWWAVRLKEPAPIVCTYMARRPPAFVRNLCGARHLNIAHGLYPRQALPAAALDALAAWLRANVSTASGRTYAGGLTKFEPRELERIRVPRPQDLGA